MHNPEPKSLSPLSPQCIHISSILIIHLPRPSPHGDLALDGVDAVADGGEDDEEDDYYDGDGDVALDHCCGVMDRFFFFSLTVWVEKKVFDLGVFGEV